MRPYVSPFMISEESFRYAMESTEVIRAPERRIETFGTTRFRFFLITELMDSVNEVRVRDGRIEAERPQILTPGHYSKLLLEGFGEQARDFAEWLEHHRDILAILKYGFRFRRSEVAQEILRRPVDEVIDMVQQNVQGTEDELSAIIRGVDDAWEVCLLKFTIDLVQQSAGDNLGDFRQRGFV
jgi:hypothetical protein